MARFVLVVSLVLAAACSGESAQPAATSVPPATAATLNSEASSTIVQPPGPTTTVLVVTSEAASTTIPAMVPLDDLLGIGAIEWSLPPRFGARGTSMPFVVAAHPGVAAIDLVDAAGDVLAEFQPLSDRFWRGDLSGSAVTGEELVVRAIARTDDGAIVESNWWTTPLMPANGFTLESRPLALAETVVHPIGAPILGTSFPDGEGEGIGPTAVAAVSETEVAVLDTVNERLVCFDLDGGVTCSVRLPVRPDGDLIGVGDGTLIVVDFESVAGDQAVRVLRVDPRSGVVDDVFEEYPLVVDGFPGVAFNTRFDFDPATATTWVGVPEYGGPGDQPEPDRYLKADALHLRRPVSRGPTVVRPALRPNAGSDGLSLVDGGAWVTLDGINGAVSVLSVDVTPTGAIVMLVWWSDDLGSRYALTRWKPGEQSYELAPLDYDHPVGSTTRVVTALDDNRVVVLDQSGRVRMITMAAAD